MWAWLRLGTARVLLLAALLSGVNIAAMRYSNDTQAATSTPEYSSLGGMRAWRLAYEPPRRNGLLDEAVWPDTRALKRWSTSSGTGTPQPAVWRTSWGVMVQKANERTGTPYGVWVVTGMEWPPDACWLLGYNAANEAPASGERLALNQLGGCTQLDRVDANPENAIAEPILAQTQRELQILGGNERVLIIGPELANRVFGGEWPQYTAGAWVGAGAVPASVDKPAQVPSVTLAMPASLEALKRSGWTVHEIRHEPSNLVAAVQQAKARWRWAMAALGLAVGALAAWGYRHVLSLLVAVRRTGGAPWWPKWVDALRLSGVLGAVMIAASAVVVALVAAGNTSATQTAVAAANWMFWPWAGLMLGLVPATTIMTWRAHQQGLQTLFARGGQG